MAVLLIALRPGKLVTPTLRHVDDDIIMTWQSPSNGDIISYHVDCRWFIVFFLDFSLPISTSIHCDR